MASATRRQNFSLELRGDTLVISGVGAGDSLCGSAVDVLNERKGAADCVRGVWVVAVYF